MSTNGYPEPIFDVAQLAHVEIYTPDMDGTLWFFKELIGLEETERHGDSVYLRAYEDWYHHTLKVTKREKPGLGHVAWRTSSPQALERRVRALEEAGLGDGWIEEIVATVGPIVSTHLTAIRWSSSGTSSTTRRPLRQRRN